MYNTNKGGNTLDESEILEPIHTCLRELIERESKGLSHTMEYTDDDVIAVSMLYTLVLGNRFFQILDEEKVGIGMSKEMAENFSTQIRQVTLAMSRVDLKSYYKDKR